ncbi:MAG: MCE family protein [Bacteroidales bacterium]|nr:MCE family protein [Bacteroidales bacterium]
MKKLGIAALCLVIIAVVVVSVWFGYKQHNSITIVFAEAYGISSGASVLMNGVVIGNVKNIKLASDGVEVIIVLNQNVREYLTTNALFAIDPGVDNGSLPVVRVKAGQAGGAPLAQNARLKGMNSFVLWQVTDIPQKINDFINDPHLQNSLQQIEKLTKGTVDE